MRRSVVRSAIMVRGFAAVERLALTSSLTVAVLLIGVFHAPKIPVLLGCAAALAVVLVRARRKVHPKL